VLDLGDQCIAGRFRRPGDDRNEEPRLPLQLVRCDRAADEAGCGLLQLRHTVPGSALYSSYWYRSGINRTMTQNLHEIAGQATNAVGGLRPGDLVIDVGCNDGTLFDGYADPPADVTFLGMDPSDVTRYAVAKGYDVVRDFFSHAALAERYPDRKARVITSIAMFYDLERPTAFVADIAQSLAPDGIWVSEFSYMPTMLAMNSFDTICHEHLEYYSFAVIERVLATAGLEVVRAELNDVNGGSIRLFAGHAGARAPRPEDAEALAQLRADEARLALDTAAPYEAFQQRVEQVRDDLLALLRRLRDEQKSIHVYGASTKGNTTLQYMGIDTSLVDCVADRNPDKWGSETIGTHIPIVSEDDSRALAPDYYLVLPWHFLEEFVEREAAFFARGGKFIVPLPNVQIVDGGASG
jgi:SAM-dependent methyltransferase